jgi:hypothetical protein
MRTLISIISIILCLSVILIGACRNEKIVPIPCASAVSKETISYNYDVYPVIATNCALSKCHVTGFEKGNFTNYEEIKRKADSGILRYMIITEQMPHGNTKGQKYLTDCEKTKILTWIEAGAKNN